MPKTVKDRKLRQAFIDDHGLSEHLGPDLLPLLKLKAFEPGEHLIEQASELTTFYLLVQGKLQVEHYQPDGYKAVFALESAFSVLGDLELFQQDTLTTLSTVQATTRGYVFELPVQKVLDIGLNQVAFLRFIGYHLSEKLRSSAQLHSNAAFKSSYKLKRYIALRTKREGMELKLENRDTLAAVLSISVRQLARALEELAEQGIISYKNKSLQVLDPAKLNRAQLID